jgi:hypothetical protein
MSVALGISRVKFNKIPMGNATPGSGRNSCRRRCFFLRSRWRRRRDGGGGLYVGVLRDCKRGVKNCGCGQTYYEK